MRTLTRNEILHRRVIYHASSDAVITPIHMWHNKHEVVTNSAKLDHFMITLASVGVFILFVTAIIIM